MKLVEIAQLLEAYQIPPVAEALPRIKAVLGDLFDRRVKDIATIKSELDKPQPNMQWVANKIAALRRTLSPEVIMADADQAASKQIYGGDTNQLHWDSLAIGQKWLEMLTAMSKEKGVRVQPPPRRLPGQDAMGYIDPSNRRVESREELTSALLEMGIPVEYHGILLD